MQVHDYPYSAQRKAGATGSVNLGVDITGPRTQVAPVGSGTSCTSPPSSHPPYVRGGSRRNGGRGQYAGTGEAIH